MWEQGGESLHLLQPAFRVLLIEDNPGDTDLVKATLAEAEGAKFELHCSETLLTGLDRLARGDFDLVLLDLSLPDSHGLDGLTAVRNHAPTIPVVLLTGWNSESLALRAMQSGAQDYLIKGSLDGACPGSHSATRHCAPENPGRLSHPGSQP